MGVKTMDYEMYDNMMGLHFVSMPDNRATKPERVSGVRPRHLAERGWDIRTPNSKTRQKWRVSGREARRLRNR